MPVTDMTLARRALQGCFDGLNDPIVPQAYLFRKDFDVSDGGTAGTGVAESIALQIGGGAATFPSTSGLQNVLGMFQFTPTVAVTANASNNITVNFYKRTGTAARVLIATGTTIAAGLGSLSAFVPVTIPVSSPPISFLPGDVITFEIVKNGTGAAFAAATASGAITVNLGAG